MLGPPLILASASTDWPDGWTVRFVVPHPYMLSSYDDCRFRKMIRDQANVYVGEDRSDFFSDSRSYFSPGGDSVPGRAPLFPGGAVRHDWIDGQPVRVVRSAVEPPPTTSAR